jgi:signal transduction histidine kinase
MDLHDEMGSGLGSIGILSELAAGDELDRPKQQEVAREIADTAGELGTALTEIVWTLRPGTTTLESLAYHLAERGGRLFPGESPALVTEFPSPWPRVELSLAVRRSLLLIASEALHNAARHAQPHRVVLGVAPASDRKRWVLWVADDGQGWRTVDANSGMGLENMRRRARDIRAEISFETNGGGTRVSTIFEPKAEKVRTRKG